MKYPVHPKVPLVPMQNGIHPMAPAQLTTCQWDIEYYNKYPQMHAPGHPHIDAMRMSSCHVVNGVPAPGNFQPMRMNSGNDMVIDTTAADPTPMIPPNNGMS
ncbi:hypothetical protein Rs2_16212 [Raphanus sativus]|nr:hypothetical protein Rs2_16212 [Raphanus sativus]